MGLMKTVVAAQNLGGELLWKSQAEMLGGKLMRKTSAENLGRKPMHHTIYDRTKVDVEISAPGKIFAPTKS